MASPRQRRQRKVLLREQEREEVLEVLPVEEDAPKAKKKVSKKVSEIFTAFADDEDDE